MTAETIFQQDYEKHLQHLSLKGLQPKMIDGYARSIRSIGKYFDDNISNRSEQQLTNYFVHRLHMHSCRTVKLDLYGIKSSISMC